MFAFTSNLSQNPRPIKGTAEYDTSGLLGITDHGLELDNLLSTNKSLYEWIRIDDAVVPYFDIDYHVPDGTNDEMFRELVHSTLDEAVCVLCERFPDLSNGDLRVSSYNGKCDDGSLNVSMPCHCDSTSCFELLFSCQQLKKQRRDLCVLRAQRQPQALSWR